MSPEAAHADARSRRRRPQSFAIWPPGEDAADELKSLLHSISTVTGERYGFIVRRLLRAEARKLGVMP